MMKKKKIVLLTGVGGSIAAHFLAHIMHNTDWHVIGTDSFRHKGLTDRIIHTLEHYPEWKKRLTIITHDLTVPFSTNTIKKIGKVNYIINMASLSDVFDSIEDPAPFIRNNVDLVINMLELAREIKPEVFIQISTDEVYGACAKKNSVGAKEWDPIIPSNPYAASKAAQEAIAISYWRTYNIPLIITNTMNNFGSMQQSNKFPVIIQKALMKGKHVYIHKEKNGEIGSRSYIHSRNFADAILFLIKNTKPHMHQPLTCDKPERYNIAGDIQLDNLELAKLIAKLMKKKLKSKLIDSHSTRPGHDPHYGLDDTKIKSLGWKPPISFEQSLKDTIDWQLEHKEWIE